MKLLFMMPFMMFLQFMMLFMMIFMMMFMLFMMLFMLLMKPVSLFSVDLCQLFSKKNFLGASVMPVFIRKGLVLGRATFMECRKVGHG